MNILFIMFDQLRFDYLSCAGHPHLHTPNLDWLASRGVRFSRHYVQSPVCGASRMSFYTGRYVNSHGASWNGVPLRVGEVTLGEHLRAAGMDAILIGKTHMRADQVGMQRLGINRDDIIGVRVAECGFDPHIRDDGLWGRGPDGDYDEKHSPYNAYLKSRGYGGENPWHDYANSGVDADGNIASGWLYQNATLPANIVEEDSETPWLTRAAIRFLQERETAATPWLCHLSYIKPHWPYIAPAPYHAMYRGDSYLPVRRHADELRDANPVYAAFAGNAIGRAFQQDAIRDAVLGAYMGLIKQIDDQMGVLFSHLKQNGRMDDTMIVVTSDHGEYMGDHWLGEKDLFHAPSVLAPLIVYDPSAAADGTRGAVCDALVESVDLAPTFVQAAGGAARDEYLEGKSLLPFLHGDASATDNWREFAISEYDYAMTEMAPRLGVSAKDARLFMVADDRWKFMWAEGGLPPMLFDLREDPDEFVDLGRDPGYAFARAECMDKLFAWTRRCSQRTALSDAELVAMRGRSRRRGIVLGEVESDSELMVKYRGALTPP